jgi:hypothetical protein
MASFVMCTNIKLTLQDLRFSYRRRGRSSGLKRCTVRYSSTDVSDERFASIFRVE